MRALLTGLLAIGLCAAGLGQQAAAADFGEPLPSFAELEAAGAVIGKILVDPQDIFDEADPRENYGLYRLLNTLHINTRASVIRRQLLFRSGERVSRQRIEETERLLRANSYLYDVSIRPVALRQGVVDIEVRTRDTWTLQPGASYSRGGGSDTACPGVSVPMLCVIGVASVPTVSPPAGHVPAAVSSVTTQLMSVAVPAASPWIWFVTVTRKSNTSVAPS